MKQVFSYIWPNVCVSDRACCLLSCPFLGHLLGAFSVGVEGCCLLLLKSSLLQEEKGASLSLSWQANVALPIICAKLSPVYLCLPYWKAKLGRSSRQPSKLCAHGDNHLPNWQVVSQKSGMLLSAFAARAGSHLTPSSMSARISRGCSTNLSPILVCTVPRASSELKRYKDLHFSLNSLGYSESIPPEGPSGWQPWPQVHWQFPSICCQLQTWEECTPSNSLLWSGDLVVIVGRTETEGEHILLSFSFCSVDTSIHKDWW